jgi:hypothetical protein
VHARAGCRDDGRRGAAAGFAHPAQIGPPDVTRIAIGNWIFMGTSKNSVFNREKTRKAAKYKTGESRIICLRENPFEIFRDFSRPFAVDLFLIFRDSIYFNREGREEREGSKINSRYIIYYKNKQRLVFMLFFAPFASFAVIFGSSLVG